MEKQTLRKNLQNKLSEWRSKAEELEVQLNLGKMDARDEVEERRKALRLKLHETRQKIDAASEEAEERWDDFSDKWEDFSEEMREGFSHLSKGVKQLMS